MIKKKKFDKNEIFHEIILFLSKLNPSINKSTASLKAPLLEDGLVDSHMALELINFVEDKYKTNFSKVPFTKANFGSIDKIIKQIIKNKKK